MLPAFDTVLVALDGRAGGLDAAALGTVLTAEGRRPILVDVPSHGRRVERQLLQCVRARDADLLVVWAHAHHAVRRMPCPVAIAPRGYSRDPPRAVRTVGVGYEDDATGRAVLDVARTVAWQLSADVHATTIVPPSNWSDEQAGSGWRAVSAARRMAEIPGVHGSVLEGDAERALETLSRKVDLLVIGSHHHNALWRLIHRDIADDLAHHARCPLLVLPRPPG